MPRSDVDEAEDTLLRLKAEAEAMVAGLAEGGPGAGGDAGRAVDLKLKVLRRELGSYKFLVSGLKDPQLKALHDTRLKGHQRDVQYYETAVRAAQAGGPPPQRPAPAAHEPACGDASAAVQSSIAVLTKASALQDESLASLARTQAMAAQSQQTAERTAVMLTQQRETLARINGEAAVLEAEVKGAQKKVKWFRRWKF